MRSNGGRGVLREGARRPRRRRAEGRTSRRRSVPPRRTVRARPDHARDERALPLSRRRQAQRRARGLGRFAPRLRCARVRGRDRDRRRPARTRRRDGGGGGARRCGARSHRSGSRARTPGSRARISRSTTPAARVTSCRAAKDRDAVPGSSADPVGQRRGRLRHRPQLHAGGAGCLPPSPPHRPWATHRRVGAGVTTHPEPHSAQSLQQRRRRDAPHAFSVSRGRHAPLWRRLRTTRGSA